MIVGGPNQSIEITIPSRKCKQRLSSLNARSPRFPESVSTWPQNPATVVETFDLTRTLSRCPNRRKSPPRPSSPSVNSLE